MADVERPGPGEPVHLRHAHLGGALCRMRVDPAPWVTENIGYVTCSDCRAQLAKPVVARVKPLPAEPIVSPGSGVFVRPNSKGLCVHVAARRFGVEGASSLCGKAARDGLNLTTDWSEVTCWGCRQVMKSRRAREVGCG